MRTMIRTLMDFYKKKKGNNLMALKMMTCRHLTKLKLNRRFKKQSSNKMKAYRSLFVIISKESLNNSQIRREKVS